MKALGTGWAVRFTRTSEGYWVADARSEARRIQRWGTTIAAARRALLSATVLELLAPARLNQLGWPIVRCTDEDCPCSQSVLMATEHRTWPGVGGPEELWAFGPKVDGLDSEWMTWSGITSHFESEDYVNLQVRLVLGTATEFADVRRLENLIEAARTRPANSLRWDREAERRDADLHAWEHAREQRIKEGVPEELVDEVMLHEELHGDDPYG